MKRRDLPHLPEGGGKRVEGRRRGRAFWPVLFGVVMAGMALRGLAEGACRNPQLVRRALATPVSLEAREHLSPNVTIQWFGHNFFLLTSARGTQIVTDPLAPGMYPTPEVAPHAVTIGREHQNHNYLPLVKGMPVVLRGLRDYGAEWNRIDTRVREVHVRSVPIYHTGYGVGSMKGAAFLFDFEKLCLAHLGDLAGTLTKEQLEDLGVVDIVLIPIGGRFTMNAYVAKDVLRQIRPRVAIPMHFWDDERTLGAFLEGQPHRRHASDTVSFSRETLPAELEVIVLWHAGRRPPLSP